ncbi:translation elongation factor G [Halothermothrix orenii H 168]|uniref:Elongation factor G n=1 Tax=Halothermothrix orenii (strain H 168 / OCM 544 / DSM 9562) TaxID=373903 RepID=B8CWR0_HALOH|nr:translation elongation factor G [Halothermothrix orenii H 168]
MASVKTDKIRNLCLISHGGAGKTTITEMSLYNSGVIKEPGRVEDGTTHSDYMPEEKKHQFSVVNSFFSIPWNGNQINWVDTPGYADFRGEVSSALKIVDAAVLIINGNSGIEVNTNYVWTMAEDNNVARFVFINKMDKDGAKFDKVFEEIQNNLNGHFVPLTIPYGEGENYKGIIDLLKKEALLYGDDGESKSDIPDGLADRVEELWTELLESVVELDDELMMKYFDDEEITDKEMIKGLINGVRAGDIIPVMVGSAINNSGIKTLLNYLSSLVPAPTDIGTVTGTWEGEEIKIEAGESGPFVGQIGKTMVDPYIGKLSIFRVLSGKLNTGSEIFVPRLNNTIKASKLYKLNGEEQETVDELKAGDIGAIAKIDDLETSDTLSDPDFKVELDPIIFPEPMLTKTALPASEGDDEKMSTVLHRISQEDPTFKVEYNKVTKELLVTGMGTVHLDVIKDICKRKFGVEFVTGIPKVAYKETIQSRVEVEEKYKKQSGGRGQYGHVFLRIEPLPRGKGFEFDEEIFGGAIPSQYIPAVEKGVVEAMEEGVMAGYPVVDCKVTVYDGSYHSVDSSEMAFKIAASKAFKKGMEQAKPVLLEPIMDVEVIVPEEYMGDIMGDLNSRRGKIQGMSSRDGLQVIKAHVPQAEMFTYATDLKSLTGGHGKFTMKFAYYDKVPKKIEDEIIKERNTETA